MFRLGFTTIAHSLTNYIPRRVTKTKNKTRMPETSQYTIGYQDKRVARVEKELAIVNSKMIKVDSQEDERH